MRAATGFAFVVAGIVTVAATNHTVTVTETIKECAASCCATVTCTLTESSCSTGSASAPSVPDNTEAGTYSGPVPSTVSDATTYPAIPSSASRQTTHATSTAGVSSEYPTLPVSDVSSESHLHTTAQSSKVPSTSAYPVDSYTCTNLYGCKTGVPVSSIETALPVATTSYGQSSYSGLPQTTSSHVDEIPSGPSSCEYVCESSFTSEDGTTYLTKVLTSTAVETDPGGHGSVSGYPSSARSSVYLSETASTETPQYLETEISQTSEISTSEAVPSYATLGTPGISSALPVTTGSSTNTESSTLYSTYPEITKATQSSKTPYGPSSRHTSYGLTNSTTGYYGTGPASSVLGSTEYPTLSVSEITTYDAPGSSTETQVEYLTSGMSSVEASSTTDASTGYPIPTTASAPASYDYGSTTASTKSPTLGASHTSTSRYGSSADAIATSSLTSVYISPTTFVTASKVSRSDERRTSTELYTPPYGPPDYDPPTYSDVLPHVKKPRIFD